MHGWWTLQEIVFMQVSLICSVTKESSCTQFVINSWYGGSVDKARFWILRLVHPILLSYYLKNFYFSSSKFLLLICYTYWMIYISLFILRINWCHLSTSSYYRGVAKVGELLRFEACMDIMDLLYEKEGTLTLYRSPRSLAASTLAC